MSGKFDMSDYVDVAERIQSFYTRFPEGRLTGGEPYLLEAGGKMFIVYHARAYRDPEDLLPGDGWAWEPVPGPTQFTKDSELQNAETAAWGRAIVALGFETKKIASRQEVRNRTAEPVAAAPLADFKQHERISEGIEALTKVEPGKDWQALAEKAAKRDFGHGVKDLTGPEAEQLAGKLAEFLAKQNSVAA